jgi:hypothetical protein
LRHHGTPASSAHGKKKKKKKKKKNNELTVLTDEKPVMPFKMSLRSVAGGS